jgi:hypothetical protein
VGQKLLKYGERFEKEMMDLSVNIPLEAGARPRLDVSFLTLGIGHTWWTFPSVTDSKYYSSSREINLSAEIDNEYVVPFVEVNIDYAEAEGLYGLAGLRKEIQVMDQLMVGAEVSLGAGTNPYTDYYFGNNSKTGLVDGNIALYTQFDITDNIYVGAKLVFTAVLDSELQDVYPEYDPQDNHMIWGRLHLGCHLLSSLQIPVKKEAQAECLSFFFFLIRVFHA